MFFLSLSLFLHSPSTRGTCPKEPGTCLPAINDKDLHPNDHNALSDHMSNHRLRATLGQGASSQGHKSSKACIRAGLWGKGSVRLYICVSQISGVHNKVSDEDWLACRMPGKEKAPGGEMIGFNSGVGM